MNKYIAKAVLLILASNVLLSGCYRSRAISLIETANEDIVFETAKELIPEPVATVAETETEEPVSETPLETTAVTTENPTISSETRGNTKESTEAHVSKQTKISVETKKETQTTTTIRATETESHSETVVQTTQTTAPATTEYKPEPTTEKKKATAKPAETTHTTSEPVTEAQISAAPTQTEPKTTYKPQYSYGSAGCFVVPSVGIQVPLYHADLYSGQAQKIVDARNSAAIFLYGNSVDVIGDHRNQDFCTLTSVSVGDTARIEHSDGSSAGYVCVKVCSSGRNTGSALVDNNGNDVSSSGADLIAYTCLSTWQSIYIAYFQVC